MDTDLALAGSCSRCGCPLAGNESYCSHCGRRLEASSFRTRAIVVTLLLLGLFTAGTCIYRSGRLPPVRDGPSSPRAVGSVPH